MQLKISFNLLKKKSEDFEDQGLNLEPTAASATPSLPKQKAWIHVDRINTLTRVLKRAVDVRRTPVPPCWFCRNIVGS